MAPAAEVLSRRAAIFVALAAWLLLASVQTYFLSSAPTAELTGEKVRAWFIGNRDGVRIGVWAGTLAIVPAAWLTSLLRARLPKVYRDMYFAGAVCAIATSAVQSWSWGGLALHPEQTTPETARALLDVAIQFGPVLTAIMVATIAPVAWLAMRRRAALPRWLGWLGLIVIAEQTLETATLFGFHGFLAPGGAMNMQLGASLVLAWTVAFAVCAAQGHAD